MAPLGALARVLALVVPLGFTRKTVRADAAAFSIIALQPDFRKDIQSLIDEMKEKLF